MKVQHVRLALSNKLNNKGGYELGLQSEEDSRRVGIVTRRIVAEIWSV